jgi:hypothetical protein
MKTTTIKLPAYQEAAGKLTLEQQAVFTNILLAGEEGIRGSWLEITRKSLVSSSTECNEIVTRLAEFGFVEVTTEQEFIQITVKNIEDYLKLPKKKEEKPKVSALELVNWFQQQVDQFSNDFPEDLRKRFVNYWLMPIKGGSKTRYECEKFFDFKRRLNTFLMNKRSWEGPKVVSNSKMTEAKNF